MPDVLRRLRDQAVRSRELSVGVSSRVSSKPSLEIGPCIAGPLTAIAGTLATGRVRRTPLPDVEKLSIGLRSTARDGADG